MVGKGRKTEAPNLSSGGESRMERLAVLATVGALMFGFGVLVGRGTAPVGFDIPDLTARLTALYGTDPEPEEPVAPKLEFYQALKSGDLPEGVEPSVKRIRYPGEKKPLPKGEKTGLPAPKPPKAVSPPVVSPEPAPSPAAVIRPEKKKGRASVPKSKPAPSLQKEGRFTIQVAALKRAEDAAIMVKKFRAKGFAAYAVSGMGKKGDTWYRVRIGRYADKNAAKAALKKLSAEKVTGYVLKIDA